MKPKRIAVLGVTGSIGESAQAVARRLPDRMKIVGMAARNNVEKLANAAREFHPAAVCAGDSVAADKIRPHLPEGIRVLHGEEGLIELATREDVDMVLVAIVGTGGLRPALAAIEAGKDLAIASKEILVMAGSLIMEAAKRRGVRILPVDSEHNAIFQCLQGHAPEHVRRLILTCSGGPFRHLPQEELSSVSPEMALRHPTWQMGPKITIDSATLFNKGLEVIEARWLFDMAPGKIDVIIHPQSVIHSMVEFIDGSVLAQLSKSDMCFPIQYAVTHPDRVAHSEHSLNFAELSRLEFEPPGAMSFPLWIWPMKRVPKAAPRPRP